MIFLPFLHGSLPQYNTWSLLSAADLNECIKSNAFDETWCIKAPKNQFHDLTPAEKGVVKASLDHLKSKKERIPDYGVPDIDAQDIWYPPAVPFLEDVKVLAWNFPQFHEVEENNKFWHKGFTEWDHFRQANETE